MTKRRSGILRKLLLIAAAMLLFSTVSYTTIIDVDHTGVITDDLYSPTSLAVSGDQIAVLEPFSQQIKIFSADGILVRHVDLGSLGTGLQRLSESSYVFCDRNRKHVVAVDIDLNSQTDFVVGAQNPSDPIDIEVGSGSIFVLSSSGQILEYDLSGAFLSRIDVVDDNGVSIGFASSFCRVADGSRFYIVDQVKSKVWITDAKGTFLGRFGSFGNKNGQITRAGEICCGNDGTIYLSDRFQNRILVFEGDGTFISNIDISTGTGPGLSIPTGIAVEAEGILYVASTENASVHVFSVEKSTAETQALMAQQGYPDNGDTLAINDIHMRVQMMAFEDFSEDVIFEFEIYSQSDIALPISVDQVLPDASSGSSVLIVEWTPEVDLVHGETYRWRVRARNNDNVGDWSAYRSFVVGMLPVSYKLEQNYPNPFNPVTRISFSVPVSSQVRLEILNLLGQRIAVLTDEVLQEGSYEVIWDGRDESGVNAPSGVYFYRLSAADFVETRKMVLLK